ncbi:MAG: DUF2892 domain-containing protein [Opitutus sp.]
MKANIGSFDGAIRFVAGIVILHFGIRDIGWWGLLGLIPIAMTVTSWCPLYALLGINTLGTDGPHDPSANSRQHLGRR